MRRLILIIGAMKSGTTTLFDMLARHPAIAPARDKEPGFFAFDGVHAKGWDWYDGLFDFDPEQHEWQLEASTDYTKAPFVTGVWERMTALPDVEVKLLYIMRHPLRRIESHARHVQITRKEIGQRISPKSDHGLDAGLSAVNLSVSRYADQLDAYREAWEAGRLHCLTLEALKAEPEATMRRVYSFLELEPLATELMASNVTSELTHEHPVWGRLAGVRPLMAAGRTFLPEASRTRIRGLFRRKMHLEGRFRLTPEEETALHRLYADDLTRLRTLYGVDTGPWEIG